MKMRTSFFVSREQRTSSGKKNINKVFISRMELYASVIVIIFKLVFYKGWGSVKYQRKKCVVCF